MWSGPCLHFHAISPAFCSSHTGPSWIPWIYTSHHPAPAQALFPLPESCSLTYLHGKFFKSYLLSVFCLKLRGSFFFPSKHHLVTHTGHRSVGGMTTRGQGSLLGWWDCSLSSLWSHGGAIIFLFWIKLSSLAERGVELVGHSGLRLYKSLAKQDVGATR